ncbi:type II toxin-antitoxin system RelE/ParE family toxin [Bacterioplanoides sp.]|uniref:type II toxin-antitoxin system RelE/ParE family toxin n=1 Tax=Bacterioplanoides sp. TaxID=2066072 RepID=UPI003B0075C4
MEIIWTQEALERLEDIQYYLAVQERSPQAAKQTLDRIFVREAQIREMPFSGRVVPDYDAANLRELLEGSYRIIYMIQDDRILILSVMHQSRLLTKVRGIKE